MNATITTAFYFDDRASGTEIPIRQHLPRTSSGGRTTNIKINSKAPPPPPPLSSEVVKGRCKSFNHISPSSSKQRSTNRRRLSDINESQLRSDSPLESKRQHSELKGRKSSESSRRTGSEGKTDIDNRRRSESTARTSSEGNYSGSGRSESTGKKRSDSTRKKRSKSRVRSDSLGKRRSKSRNRNSSASKSRNRSASKGRHRSQSKGRNRSESRDKRRTNCSTPSRQTSSRSTSRRRSSSIRSESPMSSRLSISGSIRRSSRRESAQTSDTHSRTINLRGFSIKTDSAKVHPHSKFTTHEFSDPACPFDSNGYCVMHPDVRMAKMKTRGWKMIIDECPKCADLTHKENMNQDQSAGSGDTESMTSSSPTQDSYGDMRSTGNSVRASSFRERPSRREGHDRNPRFSSFTEGTNRDRSRARSKARKSEHNHRDDNDFDDYSRASEARSRHGDRDRDYNDRDDVSCRSRSRARDRARSKSRGPRSASRSVASQSRRRSRRRSEKTNSKRTVCVDGIPFDKNGCCFVHRHIKLASKKMLGGWKIHMEFCPACASDECEDDNRSVASGVSDATGFTSSSKVSCVSGRSNVSGKSTASWTSNQDAKKSTNPSFLPLDADGFCVNHPDVQLAKVSKNGDWQVLLDFCPECAGDSLMIGGALGGTGSRGSSKKNSSRRLNSDEASLVSEKSGGSEHNGGMFVEKMPFIDDDGKPGHYTGDVDVDGKPGGRGVMKYVDGRKFDGVWEAGSKVHGVVSGSKKSTSTRGNESSRRRQSRTKPSDHGDSYRSHRYSMDEESHSNISYHSKSVDPSRRQSHRNHDSESVRRQSCRSKSRASRRSRPEVFRV